MARRPQWLPRTIDVAGIILTVVVASVAYVVARLLPATPYLSDILLGLLLGAVVLNTPLRRLLRLELPGRDREPDRYANGLRWVGKWLLRLAIILLGLNVKTSEFHAEDLLTIFGIIALALPAAFMITHAVAVWAGVRTPMADLLAGGTMICGASAVNAIAPAVGAHRDEQGVAIAAVFLFSVVALLVYRPIAAAVGLDPHHAGLWAGLSVNDLSSAIAVGGQMKAGAIDGGAFAAAAKSSRVLMLAPILILFALGRGTSKTARQASGLRASAWAAVPRYLFGYIALAGLRTLGDHTFAGQPAWAALVHGNHWLVNFLLLIVVAGVGLHIEARTLIGSSLRAVLVGGAASMWMAGTTLAMIILVARAHLASAGIVGCAALAVAFVIWRAARVGKRRARQLEARFADGRPLCQAAAGGLLAHREALGGIDEVQARQL
jgi:uncharacterized membrane protein YadS